MAMPLSITFKSLWSNTILIDGASILSTISRVRRFYYEIFSALRIPHNKSTAKANFTHLSVIFCYFVAFWIENEQEKAICFTFFFSKKKASIFSINLNTSVSIRFVGVARKH